MPSPKIRALADIVPEARDIVRAAAEVYVRHTKERFAGLVVHGSALKGGVIPGCSDVDLKLFLDESAFTEEGRIPLELGIAIYKDLARIDPAPFSDIQCYVFPAIPAAYEERGWLGQIPGAYQVVAGDFTPPEATHDQLLEQAHESLSQLTPDPFDLAGHLLKHGDGRMSRWVRLLCTDVWPTLYNVLTCRTSDPLEIWSLPKGEAIELLDQSEPLAIAIRKFHRSLHEYFGGERATATALAAIDQGVRFRILAKEWYEAHSPERSQANVQTEWLLAD